MPASPVLEKVSIAALLTIIAGERYYRKSIAEATGIAASTLDKIVTAPELVSRPTKEGFVAQLAIKFSKKEKIIGVLKTKLLDQSVGSAEKAGTVIRTDFRQETGICVRNIREAFGDSIEQLQAALSKRIKIAKDVLMRVEVGRSDVQPKILQKVVDEVCNIYNARDAEAAAPYIQALREARAHIRVPGELIT